MKKFVIALKLAIKTFRNNIARTIFSLLGIVIGVASVILVMSFGNGVKEFVLDQVRAFGTDVVEIEVKTPNTKQNSSQNAIGVAGSSRITTFKLKEAERIGEIEGVQSWYAGTFDQATISYYDQNKQVMIFGTTEGIAQTDEKYILEKGRTFTKEEAEGLSNVVVLGSKVTSEIFGLENPIGKKVKVKGQSFKVIGTIKERGSSGFFDYDTLIYIPLQTVMKKIQGVDYIQFAFYKAKTQDLTDPLTIQMKQQMRDFHNIEEVDDEDFAVVALSDAVDIINDVFVYINLLLLVLTSISLLVGGVGITNVMYVAVTERTYEIGLRKALGAKNSDILSQFIVESVLLTLLGGLFGVVFGFLFTFLAENLLKAYNFNIDFLINFNIVIIGFGFSAIVGLIFGIRPAMKASQLSPMEAFRK